MRVLVLGATGGIGLHIVEIAVKAGHHVVVYARSPQKLPEYLREHQNVTIVKGELQDAAQLEKALEGAEAVISSLGPSAKNGPFHPGGTPLAKAYVLLIELMRKQSVKRLIALGTASNKDPNDKFNLVFFTLVSGVATFAHSAYKDIVAIGNAVRASDDLSWTLVRVPLLTEEESSLYWAGYIGDGKIRTHLSRKAFAQFTIDELEGSTWVHKAPMLSNA